MALDQPLRQGEYALRGDYHRRPDPDWDYYPTYRAKLRVVRAYLDSLPAGHARTRRRAAGKGCWSRSTPAVWR